MNRGEGCYEVLSERAEYAVYRCEHGCLHLQVGDLNLKFLPKDFQRLVEVVTEASVRSGVRDVVERFTRVQ